MNSIIHITGTLAEDPAPNQWGFYHLRVNIPVPPNHPYIKGDQYQEIEVSVKNPASKILEKMQSGAPVCAICEQIREHYQDKSGYQKSALKNRLLRIWFAPYDRRRREQLNQLKQETTRPLDQSTYHQQHQQAKQNAYQPQEAAEDIPF